MNSFRVFRSSIRGSLHVPPSKSQTLRAILFGALGKGTTEIRRYLNGTDTHAMIAASRLFGAKIKEEPETLKIEGVDGNIQPPEDVINAGNSGIVLRFCSAVSTLSSVPVVITGDRSLRHQRPMGQLLDGLLQLGASAVSTRNNGYAPVIIKGPLKGGSAIVDGEDSQPVSALLIASALASASTRLLVRKAGEKPWIDLTLDWFKKVGVPCVHRDYQEYELSGGGRYDGFSYTVPGDFSSAAFPLAAALVTGSELTLSNVDMHDPQGDKEVIALFRQMGAKIDIDPERKKLHVHKGAKLGGVVFDINRTIDALPIVAVVACFAEGETLLYNGAVARQKECDRITCTASELRKMGADVHVKEDGLFIRGSKLKGAAVESHDDHRMAMALAVAGLGAEGETVISHTKCIAKTYPLFGEHFRAIGANIREEP